ncbi:MAG: aldo/keto reductase, partial [Candidatus Woesearchaeota archaeon]|nr:aldo/keto reductase [Candidatus Woesearchaeota archaeon]
MPPPILYGTAWKELKTEDLVLKALSLGYRGIDTANQRKHYYEEGVGNAIKKSGIVRHDLFIQTKFTYASSQDNRIPYNKNSDFTSQVLQSFESSLIHLKTDYIDSYLLHGPSTSLVLTYDDLIVWKAMETLYENKKIRMLGISNVNLKQLKTLFEKAKIKPKIVQNRCYAVSGWDKEVREFCMKNDIIYQGFSLLTANPGVVEKVSGIAKKHNKTSAQIILRFSKDIGILPLTGTKDDIHMKEDLDLDFTLDEEDR